MSEAVQIALINSLAPVFLSLLTIISVIVTWWLNQKARDKDKTEATAARDLQIQKIDSVHSLVNDRSERQDAKIEALNKEIARLTSLNPPSE